MAVQRNSPQDVMPIEADNDKMAYPDVHLEKQEAYAADEVEHRLTMGQAFKLYYKAVLWSATLSMALVMESYGTFGAADFISPNLNRADDCHKKCCRSWLRSTPSQLSRRLLALKFLLANISSKPNGKLPLPMPARLG